MTIRQVVLVSVGGAVIVLITIGIGVLSLRETCRDFKQAQVSIDNKTYNVALAEDEIEKVRGLLGCSSIPDRSGMYFPYAQASVVTFWMKGMSIPIDIVWISRGKVVGIEKNLPPTDKVAVDPPLYKPTQPVDGVLELGAGKAAQYGIKPGSIITLIRK